MLKICCSNPNIKNWSQLTIKWIALFKEVIVARHGKTEIVGLSEDRLRVAPHGFVRRDAVHAHEIAAVG